MFQTDEYYSDIAPGYNELYREEQLEKAKKVLDILRKHKVKIGKVILDVGAGTGISSEPFVNLGCRCILLEPSRKMLDQCGLSNTIKIIGKAEQMPLPAESCDGVISLTSLHHADIKQALKEIERVVKKNGWITISLLKKNAEEQKSLFRDYERENIGKDDLFFREPNQTY